MSEREMLRPLSDSQREALEEATASYEKAVTPAAAEYLHGRGIGREVAVTSRLGVVADPLPGHEKYRGMLAIPYLGHDGRVLCLRFRCMEKHDHRAAFHGKYNSVAGDSPRLYGIRSIHQATTEIHVCEGEFDAMLLTSLGMPAVAVPGASLWAPRHRRMLAGFNHIYVWGDPDEAGAELVAKVLKSLGRARAVRLRDGDVTETFLMHGEAHLRGLVYREELAA